MSITFFAQTTFRNQMRRFGIKEDDRRRHMYLVGKTGMGKSTILENMIIDDIRAGHGVAVVDPHGDLAEKIIEFIPDDRIEDVIYFNPADIEYPIAFNVVEQVDPHLRHLVASGLIGVFQKLWADSWGPRLEYILRNAILAILDYPGSTLLGVVRILSDKAFRKKVVSNIKDPVVKSFWEKEFASYADKFASEAVSPIQNKVGQFLSTAFMRNIIGQVSSSLDMRKIMDESKILIMNLSKGRIGEDNSALLGAMMITKIQLASMSRVDIEEKDRKDFYLYIDEFQNFSTDSFANILSEARKYRLCLIMAHQYIEQLSEKVKPAVFGNVGTMIVFRVGATDAEELVKEFTPTFTEEDLVNLPKYEMYLKLMIDGVASDPFSARGLPPLTNEEKTHNIEQVINFSREHYASRKADVEEKILRWHESHDDETGQGGGGTPGAHVEHQSAAKQPAMVVEKREEKVEAPARPKFDAYKYSAICANCGQETKTVFQPDGVRPVYCAECLPKMKEKKQKDLEARRLAKQEELQRVNHPQLKPVIKGLSLSELAQSKPVDFKGREIKVKPVAAPSLDEGGAEELKEGEDVYFNT
ncbi:MAG TPA: type IV secretion system DNA-binding domain-containing protein [bacterium]|nr:type IV secretion system DNA-binding domain-containing protein [bacterium]HPT29327.1 type IV secretion system DNA-binding domain-containing protein [bacterium]